MNRTVLTLCAMIVLASGRVASGQEELPPVAALPAVNNDANPCGMHYTPGWVTCAQRRCSCAFSLGRSVHSAMTAQVNNGASRYLTLHHYDFQATRTPHRLNKHGVARLGRFAMISMQTGIPVVIEADPGSPGLNLARRRFVQKALAEIDPQAPEEMVVVGTPARGLRGGDALLIDKTRLQNTENRGPILGESIGE